MTNHDLRRILMALTILGFLGLHTGVVRADLNDGLVAYWPFDDGANLATDVVGGNNGTRVNTPPYVVQTLGGNDIAPVFANQDALDFDKASQQYVKVSSPSPLLDDLGTKFTATAWVKLDLLPEGTNYLGRDSCCPTPSGFGPERGWQLGIFQSQRLVCIVTGGTGKVRVDSDLAGQVPIDQYFHTACVFDSSANRIEIYLDGVKIPQTLVTQGVGVPFPTKPNVNTGVPFVIGAHSFNSTVSGVGLHIDGRIDEVRIYNRALDDSEVRDLYRSTVPVDVDIKPGDNQNEFDGLSESTLSVSILSSDVFDATLDLDPASLSLAGASVQMLGKGTDGCGAVSDVNGDGANDVTCNINITTSPDSTGISKIMVEGLTSMNTGGFRFPIEGRDHINVTAITATGQTKDTDNDGLTDQEERAAGTDRKNPDTDEGGELDGSEVDNGRDPLDPSDDIT